MPDMIQKSQTDVAQENDIDLRVREDSLREDDRPGTPAVASSTGSKPALVLTYWLDPDELSTSAPVVVKFTGNRMHVEGPLTALDRFAKEEVIEPISAASGPVSITSRVLNVNPGEWNVRVRVQRSETSTTQTVSETPLNTHVHHTHEHFWRRWAPSVEDVATTSTRLLPFARVPGVFPGFWGVMVMVGIVVALVLQSFVMASMHLAIISSWLISLVAIMVGIVGSKCWYMVLYRRTVGWCIQGFVSGASLALILLLLLFRIPVGAFLDAATPGLFIAMAIGRIGCFFGGCCGGPITSAPWGVWSSDQRIGARRVPTQLMELLLAGIIGVGVLVLVLMDGTRGGAFFAGAIAAYTLIRQGILSLRAEPCKSMVGRTMIATFSALVLLVIVGILV
jgi:phosphatidylglycerol---prolipoprotein diacylglyceryl transferase